jgi:hypothetical protein
MAVRTRWLQEVDACEWLQDLYKSVDHSLYEHLHNKNLVTPDDYMHEAVRAFTTEVPVTHKPAQRIPYSPFRERLKRLLSDEDLRYCFVADKAVSNELLSIGLFDYIGMEHKLSTDIYNSHLEDLTRAQEASRQEDQSSTTSSDTCSE